MATRREATLRMRTALGTERLNRFHDTPAERGRVASRAPRCAPLEPTPLPTRLVNVRARNSRPRPHTPRNAPRLEDCRRPPGWPPQSQTTFDAGMSSRIFSASSRVRTHAQSRTELESPRTRAPYVVGYEIAPATALRAAALQSKRTRSLLAYARPRTRMVTYASADGQFISGSDATHFGSTKPPLRTWFLTTFLLTQPKNGISAPKLTGQLRGELQLCVAQAQVDA